MIPAMGTLLLALVLSTPVTADIVQTSGQAAEVKPAPAKEKTPEELALERTQTTVVRTIDGSLPERTLQAWLKEVFGPSGSTTWELTDCASQMGGPIVDRSSNAMCVAAKVRLDAKRVLHLVFNVTVPKPGARALPPTFAYGVVMDGGTSLQWLKSLGEASRIR